MNPSVVHNLTAFKLEQKFLNSGPQPPAIYPSEFRIPRERMIERLRNHYGIRDVRVLRAMSEVP